MEYGRLILFELPNINEDHRIGEILDEYKLFVHRIGLVGITNILIALSSLILLPILTKNFSLSEYGFWVQINTTIALIPAVATLGLPYTMVRFLSAEKDKDKIQEGFYSISLVVLVSTVIITIIMLIFSKNIAFALFDGEINLAVLLSLLVFFACFNTLFINFFRTFQQMKRYSIFLLIQTYLGLLIVSILAINGFGIFISSLGLLFANLIIFLIMILFIISDINLKIPKLKNVREYLSFGLPTVPGNLSYWVVESIDRYLIGIMLGAPFVAYYSPGYTLGNVILMVLAPFSFLLPSILPEYYDENNIEKVRIFLKYSLKYFLLMAIPVAFGLSFLSKPILLWLTTPEIAQNGYLITPFILFSAILFGIYGIISNVIVLKKKTKIIGTIWIAAAILNFVLNMVLIPYFGIIGAAAVTSFSYFFAFIMSLSYSFKFFKFEFDYNFIIKSIFASLLFLPVIFAINPREIISICLAVIICMFIYVIAIMFLKGINKKEIKFLKELLLK